MITHVTNEVIINQKYSNVLKKKEKYKIYTIQVVFCILYSQ